MQELLTDTTRRVHDAIFRHVHGRNLVYNTCWEDPAVDRHLMRIDSGSRIVMITSAGCNALDYLLDRPEIIHAVDMNPRQNALLELKLALIRRGIYDDLFQMFGQGFHPEIERLYPEIRGYLSDEASEFWDKNLDFFGPHRRGRSFYYRGTAGTLAWFIRKLLNGRRDIRKKIETLLDAETIEEQRQIYEELEPLFWNRFMKWFIGRRITMAMLGVPRPQMNLINRNVPGGMPAFVQEKLRRVFTETPLRQNYFWRLYLTGSYTRECCPSYLKKSNFEQLQARVDTVRTHTTTVERFLAENPGLYTHFVLLDHQDWLADHNPEALAEEWKRILGNCRPGSRILMRSAGTEITFLPEFVRRRLEIPPESVGTESVPYDRVGTYGSLLFAEVTG